MGITIIKPGIVGSSVQQFVAKNVAKDHWEGLIDRLGAAVATAETSIVTSPTKTISGQ